jgi:glutathione S-transferase
LLDNVDGRNKPGHDAYRRATLAFPIDAPPLSRLNSRETPGGPMLKLFYAPRTCAFASLIALEDAGAEYELARLSFAKAEQRSPDFLKINPKGRVPALATDRGALTETPAILAYIAQTHPEKRLAPLDDPFAFAQVQAFAAYLCATVHVAHAHRPRGSRWADEPASIEDMKRKTPANMRDCFGLIQSDLFRGPWAMGESYSVIDAYLFAVSGWLGSHDIDIAEFPVIADHHRRVAERPSVQRAIAADAA